MEAFKISEIDRAQIQFADYNPRTITAASRDRLRRAIKKVGLLGPITWNRRSGRVVSGHQRLKAMDALNNGTDYRLTVAEVDMDEAAEKSANILMNNPEAQGEWDFEALGKMLKEPELDLEAAGMGSADVYRIVGADDAPPEVLADAIERLEAARDMEKKINESKSSANPFADDYYLVVTFRDHDARRSFTDSIGLDDNRYQSGEDIQAHINSSHE